MPPMRPASTMSRSAWPWSAMRVVIGDPSLFWILMTALVTVRATSTLRKAPMRLRMPERATAVLGLRAPVAMDVAIALPVSWKPLVKSKARAVMTTSTRRMRETSTGPIVRRETTTANRGPDAAACSHQLFTLMSHDVRPSERLGGRRIQG